jgi:hypothetical protein
LNEALSSHGCSTPRIALCGARGENFAILKRVEEGKERVATEQQIKEVLRRYLAKAPAFANDHANAVSDGVTVRDDIDVAMKNACGHPTAGLTRIYDDHDKKSDKTYRQWRSTFDIKLVRGEWTVRCSSGLPGD